MNARPRQSPNPRRLYRDTEHSVFAGVCAGISPICDPWLIKP